MLLHVHNTNAASDNVGDIVLIHLKSRDRQAVLNTISALQANPYVVYAEPDYLMDLDIIPNDQYYDNLWGLKKIDAPRAWEKFTGSGDVVVGVIDSGIYHEHTDLKENLWIEQGVLNNHGWDFYNDNHDPLDENGHGTHVAGTIGAIGNNRIGITGVSWDVKIASLKVVSNEDSRNVCSSAAIKAIKQASELQMPILNNSWGGRNYCESLKTVIKQYSGLFIAAAGNNGADNDSDPHYPASYDCDNIISVAATDQNDNLTSFSNYGANTVDIAAPGIDIYSPLLSGEYGYLSGTSMAAPHVAGAAALLKGYRPKLSTLELKEIILYSSDRVPQLCNKVLTGGRLNINTMLEAAAIYF